MHIVLSLVIASLVSLARPEVATQYKDLILELHNGYREKQMSSNMVALEWDDQLANEANVWVSKCVYRHNNTNDMEGRGENLAWDSSHGGIELIKGSMADWYDEINYYNYMGKACHASCHYTQIVWAKTRKVGCALKSCDRLAESGWGKRAGFFACWYSPKGNDMSEYPYERGAPCSKCLKGQTCKDKLCSGEGEEVCEDLDSNCAGFEAAGQCKQNRPYMIKRCRQSCEFCKGGKKNPADCKDVSPASDCQIWKDDCQANKPFMKPNCMKTCGFC